MTTGIQASISIDHVIEVLNQAVQADPQAMRALVEQRVPCNDALRDHPTIQVSAKADGTDAEVGFLGVLNGLFGIDDDGWGPIASVYAVKCPQGCPQPDEFIDVGTPCGTCGSTLVLGDLLEFTRSPAKVE